MNNFIKNDENQPFRIVKVIAEPQTSVAHQKLIPEISYDVLEPADESIRINLDSNVATG